MCQTARKQGLTGMLYSGGRPAKGILGNFFLLRSPFKTRKSKGSLLMHSSVTFFFWSKHLTDAQQKYSTYKRELLAIRLAVRHFLPMFYGRKLIIWTDHQSLCGSFKSQNQQMHSPIENNWIKEILSSVATYGTCLPSPTKSATF